MVELVGDFTVDKNVPDGKAGPMVIVATPEFQDGVLIALHVDRYDYTFHLERSHRDPTRTQVYASSTTRPPAAPALKRGQELGAKARQASESGFY